MIDNQVILNKVKEYNDYIINTRHYLHENPELSLEEFKTSEFLQEEVRKRGLEVTMVTETGFYAVLDTGRPGKIIGMRTDIDALPIQEQDNNLAGKRLCKSKIDGVMHACGHDGHMAVMLGAVNILSDLKDSLSGKIVFIFEAAEEIGAGVKEMVAALKPLGISAIYGTHLASFMETGTICVDAGPRMAGSALIDMNIIGRSGHGSRPDLSINPVFGAAQVLNALSVAWVNQLDVNKTVTLGITQIIGGTANNVIPDKVYISGSLRFFDVEAGQAALDVLKRVSEQTASVHNCRVEFGPNTRMGTRPVINDDALAAKQIETVASLYPGKLVHDVKWYASESFNRYRDVAPSLFAFVGIASETYGSGAEHHNDFFDLDDDALQYSLGSTVLFALNNL